MKKKLAWLAALLMLFAPLLGCSFLTGLEKNSEGYYERHYHACGPIALEKAFSEYYRREGIAYCARRDQLSRQIQDTGMVGKEILSFFNKDAIQITWPHEIKMVAEKHGFEIITINDFEKLDPKKDIAFVLVRSKFFSEDWHWMCYPVDMNIKNYFGSDTVIDKILLLKKIN